MNKKTGLMSFHLDVDIFEDEKMQFVSARFGTKGEAITIRLLCKIYRQGYFIDWNDDIALLFAKGVGDNGQHSCVKDVVCELLKRDFFDKGIFERFSILTSRRIQRQYFEASKRRKEAFYTPGHLLIDVSEWANATPVNQNVNILSNDVNILSNDVNILDGNADGLKQSKVKKSKAKEIKDTSADAAVPPVDNRAENADGTGENVNILDGNADGNKRVTKTYEVDSVEYKSTQYLIKKILERDPGAKVPKTETQIQGWCVHIDRILRLDKRSPEQLREVLMYAATDSFWSGVVLSTKGLREKFDKLVANMQRPKSGKPETTSRNSINKNYEDGDTWP